MEHEVNGLDYRYVYGNERLSVNISPIENGAGSVVESGTVGQQIRLYYHQDLRGTVDYLTSPVSQKVESWTHYNEWGEITHNAVLKMGQRELDLVKNYTGHDFDAVLNLYYAKARMYDAENRRFTSLDPIMDGSVYDISGRVTDPMMFVQYLYVKDNSLTNVDPLGLVSYPVLNLIGYGLAVNFIPHEIALTNIMLGAGMNPWLAGHQLAQAFAYKWLYQDNGYRLITLEMTLPNENKRVDVVAQRGSEITLFEIKHRTMPLFETYEHAQNVLQAANKQLSGYYETLGCYLLDGYSLSRTYFSGQTQYKLFEVGKTSVYINLRHQPTGVIEY